MANPNSAQNFLTLFELNEFNNELLLEAIAAYQLPNLAKLTALSKTHTFTEDTYDSNFLEPWVQWVSVHTGTTSAQHQIKHLGDVPHLGTPQIWETLSESGISSGAWGVMNASRGKAEHCAFFFPDPWTASEPGYPAELAQLLALPRYLSKNYLKINPVEMISRLGKFTVALWKSGALAQFLTQVPVLLGDLLRHGNKHYVFIAHLDLFTARLFARYKRRTNPQLAILFVNTIAHVQHHYWRKSFPLSQNKAMHFCFQKMDEVAGVVWDSLRHQEKLLMLNALSQKNTNEEPTWLLYRQRDHRQFLEQVGLRYKRVEAHMTYDAHIFFNTPLEKETARNLLEQTTLSGQKFFIVETYADDPLKLFYRIDFSMPVHMDAILQVGSYSLHFLDFFEIIVERTGKHIPNGSIYSDLPNLPARMPNHQLYSEIINYFEPKNTNAHVPKADSRAPLEGKTIEVRE